MAALTFFVGKGGVGKTSVSAAYAVHLARGHSRRSVLLLSTDPAHSLADIFQRRFGDQPSAVEMQKSSLHVWQVNAEKEFRKFLAQYEDQLLATIEAGSIFTRADIKPLLDTALPGMAEISGLLAIQQAVNSGRYDRVVVDTAPFGHTLRLFTLPEQFARLLRFFEIAGSRDQILAEHFGGGRVQPPEFLERWRAIVEGMGQALAHQAELFLVATPEQFAINESLRCADELEHGSPPLRIAGIVLNRVVGRATCPACRTRAKAARSAMRTLTRRFPGRQLRVAEDAGSPVLGADNLGRFAAHIFSGKPLRLASARPPRVAVKLRPASWPGFRQPLALVLGKGGVGKTTVASALAFRARQENRCPVTICSVDPAPSLDDVFGDAIGDRPQPVLGDSGLRASEMDSVAAFGKWVQGVRDQIDSALTSQHSGVHVDVSFERQLFSSLLDIVPPGVDEVFAVFRIMDLLADRSQQVVIDMAPTGHALELLRLPARMLHWSRLLLKTLAAHRTLALARDVAVQIAEFGQRARELAQMLKDAGQSRLWVVMLAEALPDRETERLMRALRELELPVAGLFVNRVLFPEDIRQCVRCRRARQWQLAMLRKISRTRRGAGEIYVIRNFSSEVAGKSGLRAFTSELWEVE